ncbi:unnamed protein product [Paramecium octaurelia]|uniref:Uncharacterized protein n=1 Tax=Paramecium octaurelia TaxID=43137 RepID=A0A8S1URA0_PAROT|nr:unnamed protein product [Paramecium octaurelia]
MSIVLQGKLEQANHTIQQNYSILGKSCQSGDAITKSVFIKKLSFGSGFQYYSPNLRKRKNRLGQNRRSQKLIQKFGILITIQKVAKIGNEQWHAQLQINSVLFICRTETQLSICQQMDQLIAKSEVQNVNLTENENFQNFNITENDHDDEIYEIEMISTDIRILLLICLLNKK